VAIGDARLALEREAPQAFDLLVIDAFSSDAIPVHLLTLEAFQTYWRHIKPDGVLAVHVSNQYINLSPVVAHAARQSGRTARLVYNFADPANATDGSLWVLVSSRAGFLSKPALNDPIELKPDNAIRPWTDDYSNLWQLLR
jgi:spermidine synthase